VTTEPPDEIVYTYKPSLAGSAHAFRLTEEGLSFQAGFRAAMWRYCDIASVRLTYRPVSMLAHRFRADITNRQGQRLRVVSASWSGIVTLAPQNEGYCGFILALHAALVRNGARASFIAGLNPVVFTVGIFMTGVLAVAMLGLLIRAMAIGNYVAALFLVGFAGWYGWHIGGWLLRNKPRAYAPDDIPPGLLP
jgi:hypothetical protein